MDETKNNNDERYVVVNTSDTRDAKIVENLKEDGSSYWMRLDERERIIGKKKIVEEDSLVIHTSDGIKLQKDGEDYTVIFSDGTKQRLDEKNAKKLIKNGVGEGEYMAVEGVRTTTEYEKVQAKDRKKRAMALIGAFIIAVPIFIKGCSSFMERRSATDSTLPTDSIGKIDEDSISEEDMDFIVNAIYSQAYSDIIDVLDPAMVVRVAQDAYEAIDHDLEIMGGDLCDYEDIRNDVVRPGAQFVETVSDFKEKYDSMSFDSSFYQAFVTEAMPLLQQQGQWIDTATGLVERHVETTQECIDQGLRGDNYATEKIITSQQVESLKKQRSRVNEVITSLGNVEKLISGIQNGSIDYSISPNGSLVVFSSEETLLYQAPNQNAKDMPDANSVGNSIK